MIFPIRYFIYILATTCITVAYSIRLAFHSTILCQYNVTSDHFLTDANYRGWTFASVSFGLILGLIPLPFIHSLGTRNVTLIYGCIASFSAFVYPYCDSLGFWPSFASRVLQGVPVAVLLWIVNNVALEWAPQDESAFAIAILTSVYQISPMISSVISGETCTSFGWQHTYYILGTVNLIVHLLFFYLYSNDVLESKILCHDEKQKITHGKSYKICHSIPYSSILSDLRVYSIWFCYFSWFASLYTFLQYGPTYLNKILNFDLQSTGYAGALPYFILLMLKFIYGPILDNGFGLSSLSISRIAFSAVKLLSALCLLSFKFSDSRIIGLGAFILFNSVHGLALINIMRQIQQLGKQHAHILANGNSLLVAMVILLAPRVANVEYSATQWSSLFMYLGLLQLSSVFVFLVSSDTKAAKWTEIHHLPSQLSHNHSDPIIKQPLINE